MTSCSAGYEVTTNERGEDYIRARAVVGMPPRQREALEAMDKAFKAFTNGRESDWVPEWDLEFPGASGYICWKGEEEAEVDRGREMEMDVDEE